MSRLRFLRWSAAGPRVLTYRTIYKQVLRHLPEEFIHACAAHATRAVTAVPWARRLLSQWLRPHDPKLQLQALGLAFPGPVGVAGGMDKELRWFDGLGVLGFGFVEVGTITADPQAGNAKPRVFRLIEDRGLLNSLGFPNPGAAVAGARLAGKRGDTIIAANIGKSKITPLDRAGDDYRKTTAAVAPYADLLVLNVSSPNTPGLRDMQAVESLRTLVADVRSQLRSSGYRSRSWSSSALTCRTNSSTRSRISRSSSNLMAWSRPIPRPHATACTPIRRCCRILAGSQARR